MEKPKVDSLSLGKLKFQPYSYDERFEGDALIIKAKVLLSESQYTELKELMRRETYFEVVRHGISDEPREMRFGLTLWSKHKENIKHELLLVDKSYDKARERRRGLFGPESYRMQNMIAEYAEILEELLTALINKGILRAKEIDDIRADALRRAWDRKREFYRVKDIDEL